MEKIAELDSRWNPIPYFENPVSDLMTNAEVAATLGESVARMVKDVNGFFAPSATLARINATKAAHAGRLAMAEAEASDSLLNFISEEGYSDINSFLESRR